jgi:hypothetical protein
MRPILLQTTQKGFIALFSILIISITLLVTTLSLAQLSIANRFFILTIEQKTMSEKYADACVHIGRIMAYNNPEYSTHTAMTYTVHDGSCTIHSIISNGTESTMRISATEAGAITYYKIIVDTIDGEFISWNEVLTL